MFDVFFRDVLLWMSKYCEKRIVDMFIDNYVSFKPCTEKNLKH